MPAIIVCGLVAWLAGTLPAQADWPQILGPTRNGQAGSAVSLSEDWADGLKIRWQVEIGSGFGGSAIVGNRVLTLHRVDAREILQANDLKSGARLWQCDWPASYRGTINPDGGPRCVPVVAGDRVFCYGAAGDLVCVRIADGELLWQRALRQEYDADAGYFGAGSTPLALNDMVVVCVGGSRGGLVAVAQANGATRWTATAYEASYASPVAIELDGQPRVLAVMRLNTVLVDAQSGDVLGDVRFGSRGPTVNAATPIPLGAGKYFLTASYGVGAVTVQVDQAGLHEVTRQQALASQYNTPVLVGDRIVGIDGREDVGVAALKAIQADTLETVWSQAGFGVAHLIAAGPRLLALTLDGQLAVVDASASTFQQRASFSLPAGGEYRALPALAGKALVVRCSESARASRLYCVELP